MSRSEDLVKKFMRLCEQKPEEEVVPALVEILCLAMLVYDIKKTKLMSYIADEFDDIDQKREEWRNARNA